MSDTAAARERIGAIDVGSNSIRLLIAEWDPDTGLVAIDEVKEQPRLATGVARSGELDPAAMDAASQALGRMREVAARRGVSRLVAVGTSALREARNGAAFAERVRRECGIPLEIISAEREAELSWKSVTHHFPGGAGRRMVADIGGGSLELIGAVDGLVECTTSLPLGAVRLTELHRPDGHADGRAHMTALRKAIRTTLKAGLAWREWRQATLIGSGGSFTNLGRMVAARSGKPTSPIHGISVSTGEVESLLEWLATHSVSARAALPGLNPQRADIILAGIAVTAEVLDLLDAREVQVSAYGLREGLLLELVGDATVNNRSADPLATAREFLERCRADRRHAEQVRYLSLLIFDQLAPHLGASTEERGILEAAALLHDVGQLVAYRKHHKHSYQLIMHADRVTLPPRERTLVALIARYHRKSGPSRRHEEFALLSVADQEIVRRLSGILRVADGLDRGHTSSVDRLTITVLEDRCVMRAYPRVDAADLALEVWGADRKRSVLEKALGREVIIAAGL